MEKRNGKKQEKRQRIELSEGVFMRSKRELRTAAAGLLLVQACYIFSLALIHAARARGPGPWLPRLARRSPSFLLVLSARFLSQLAPEPHGGKEGHGASGPTWPSSHHKRRTS